MSGAASHDFLVFVDDDVFVVFSDFSEEAVVFSLLPLVLESVVDSVLLSFADSFEDSEPSG